MANTNSSSLSELLEQEQSLRTVIKERPQNGRAMAKLACLLADQAKLVSEDSSRLRNEALEWAQCSIKVAPEKPYGHMALSVLEEKHSDRMDALRKSIRYHTGDDSDFGMIGLLLRLLREPRLEEARQVSGKIGKASNVHPSKRALNKDEESIYERLDRALVGYWKKSDQSESNRHEIAMAEYRLGLFFRKRLPESVNKSRALKHFERAMKHLPSNHEILPVAEFWLGTLGHKSIDRCPASYVVSLYSSFAENFDDLLVEKLLYQTPTILRSLVDECDVSKKFRRGLDLGCGTGLSGIAFRDKISDELVGVDLSPEMISKAKERGCYNSLHVGDVTSCLTEQEESYFDFVTACDVLVYLGNLQRVLEGVHRVLAPNGIFAFSTELLIDGDDSEDYVLHECARFSHSRAYIERLASSGPSRFEVLQMTVRALRKNKGKDVMGLLTILRKID